MQTRLPGSLERSQTDANPPRSTPTCDADPRPAQRATFHRPLTRTLRQVLDLGCGEGRLLAFLRTDTALTGLHGVDVDAEVLRRAVPRVAPLLMDLLQPRPHPFAITLHRGSVADPDPRFRDIAFAACVEVYAGLARGKRAGEEPGREGSGKGSGQGEGPRPRLALGPVEERCGPQYRFFCSFAAWYPCRYLPAKSPRPFLLFRCPPQPFRCPSPSPGPRRCLCRPCRSRPRPRLSRLL